MSFDLPKMLEGCAVHRNARLMAHLRRLVLQTQPRSVFSLHNWVMANQRMAAVLKANSYDYRYVFAEAAGHTDGRVTRQTLPGAMEWRGKDTQPGDSIVPYIKLKSLCNT